MAKVFIARGHGLRDDGVYDPGASARGWSEQSAVDVVAPIVTADLRRAGVDVHDEGEDDPNYPGSIRAANRIRPDRFVALHFDWSGGWDSHAYYHSTSSDGQALARAIVDALDAAGRPIQGFRQRARDELAVLSRTKDVAVLVELGRIGDPSNDETHELEEIGHAVARGIADDLGVSIPSDTPEPVREVRAVAVGAHRRPDTVLASMVGDRHGLAAVRPLEDGRWLQRYPGGRTEVVDHVEWMIAIGWKAAELVAQADDGRTLVRGSAEDTGIAANALIVHPRLEGDDRRRSFADHPAVESP